jgi:hypothetical protein
MIKTNTTSREVFSEADLATDSDDIREAALERAFTQHDSLEFDGKPIRPVSAGSMAMMQRTKNGLIFGDKSNLLFDTASFVIIHTDDERAFRRVKDEAKGDNWFGYVIDWLDATEAAQAKLTQFAPQIAELMNDYGSALTKQLESTPSGNDGGRIG